MQQKACQQLGFSALLFNYGLSSACFSSLETCEELATRAHSVISSDCRIRITSYLLAGFEEESISRAGGRGLVSEKFLESLLCL